MLPASTPGPPPNSPQMRLKSVSNLDSDSSTLTTPSHSPNLPQTSQIMLNNDCGGEEKAKTNCGLPDGVTMSRFYL